jgi:hypothetical protein
MGVHDMKAMPMLQYASGKFHITSAVSRKPQTPPHFAFTKFVVNISRALGSITHTGQKKVRPFCMVFAICTGTWIEMHPDFVPRPCFDFNTMPFIRIREVKARLISHAHHRDDLLAFQRWAFLLARAKHPDPLSGDGSGDGNWNVPRMP